MSKYYKNKYGLIVKYLDRKNKMEFNGEVVAGNQDRYNSFVTCLYSYFKPYKPTPQELIEWGETATLSNDNPNKVEVSDKDVNLRLECLKLALQYQISNPLLGAQGFYDWITTNLIAKP